MNDNICERSTQNFILQMEVSRLLRCLQMYAIHISQVLPQYSPNYIPHAQYFHKVIYEPASHLRPS